MRVDLDAKVRARDGEEIGSLNRAIVDPQTNEVTHVVVSTGAIFGRDIVVPRENVERANQDGDTIQLDLTKDELERFPDFMPEQYGAPPPAWVAPAGYGFPASGYAWPIAMDPMMGPVPMVVPDELVDDEERPPGTSDWSVTRGRPPNVRCHRSTRPRWRTASRTRAASDDRGT